MQRLDFSHKNLLVYLTAGIPSLEFLQEAILTLQTMVDAIEIGVPYSDPVADGPVIAQASQLALEKGVNLDHIFSCLKEIASEVKIPLYLMSYYAPIYAYGQNNFIDKVERTQAPRDILFFVSSNYNSREIEHSNSTSKISN